VTSRIKCPKGHWFGPTAAANGNQCPICKASTLSNKRPISDDDVLAMLDSPKEACAAVANLDEDPPDEPRKSLHGPVMLRRNKKVCPRCSHEMSLSFEHCPRCGEPLKVVSTELR
jgi:hypothetical protein